MESEMTAQPHEYMPPVECTLWCDEGDGHPTCLGVEDQNCWSTTRYVEFSLEPALVEGGQRFPHQIGVMARRRADGRRHVYLHLDNIKNPNRSIPWPHNYLDQSLTLTPDEADALALALIIYAELARSTPGEDG